MSLPYSLFFLRAPLHGLAEQARQAPDMLVQQTQGNPLAAGVIASSASQLTVAGSVNSWVFALRTRSTPTANASGSTTPGGPMSESS